MTETQQLAGLRGPLTAHQALNAILPAVRMINAEFNLTFIGTGEGINHEGKAYEWDFFFEFPRRKEQSVFHLHLCPSEDDDEGPWCLDTRVRPVFSLPSKTKSAAGPARPALPLKFRDSVDAVRALAEQGADFIAGDSHMTLSSKILPNGAIVWHTICWDKEYQTPFA